MVLGPGETAGLPLIIHVNVIRYYAGEPAVNIVIVNTNPIQGHNLALVGLVSPETDRQDPAVCVARDVIDANRPT